LRNPHKNTKARFLAHKTASCINIVFYVQSHIQTIVFVNGFQGTGMKMILSQILLWAEWIKILIKKHVFRGAFGQNTSFAYFGFSPHSALEAESTKILVIPRICRV